MLCLAPAPVRAGDTELAVRLTEMGIQAQTEGDHVAARAYFERALAEHDHPKIRYFLGKSLHELGQLDLALAEFVAIRDDERVGKYRTEIEAFITAIEGERERRRLEEELAKERQDREAAEEARRRLAEEKRQAEADRAREEAARRTAEDAATRRADELAERGRGDGPERAGDRGSDHLDAPAPPPVVVTPLPPGAAPAPAPPSDVGRPGDVEPPRDGGRPPVEPDDPHAADGAPIDDEVDPEERPRRRADERAARAAPGAGTASDARKRAIARYRSERAAGKALIVTGVLGLAAGIAMAANPLDRDDTSASDKMKRAGRIIAGASAGTLFIAWAVWPKRSPTDEAGYPTSLAGGSQPSLRIGPTVGRSGGGLAVQGSW